MCFSMARGRTLSRKLREDFSSTRLTEPHEPLIFALFSPTLTFTTAYETHLSTLEAHPQTPVRFPRPDEDEEWP